MMETRITRLFRIEHPVIGGCMQWITGPEFTAAVCEAGALGIMSSAMFPTQEEFRASLEGVLLRAKNLRALFDEAPLAYKDIDEVVGTLVDAGLTLPVVRLKPLAVIKGEGEEA